MKKVLINYIQKPKFDEIYTPRYAIEPLIKYLPKQLIFEKLEKVDESNV